MILLSYMNDLHGVTHNITYNLIYQILRSKNTKKKKISIIM